jgi:hypothetical protein
MKFVRLIFYIVSLLIIGEVTEIISLYKPEVSNYLSSDLEETPLEEDESKELEEDDDYLVDIVAPGLHGLQSVSIVTPSLIFELSEPLNEITVPPPQG